MIALDKETLDFEHVRWRYPGAKEAAIRERFDESPTSYYARLNQIIDKPAAWAHSPQLVKRLRRQRAARQAVREARRADFEL